MVASKKVLLGLLTMNALLLGIVFGTFFQLPGARAQDNGQNEEETSVVPMGKLDQMPPKMIYQWMNIPGEPDESDPRRRGPSLPGIFLYDTVNESMRIYAFNNMDTQGSRGDIELIAVRDVRWDAMIKDTGFAPRRDDQKKFGSYEAQGMRPKDIFELLVKEKIVDKDGYRIGGKPYR